MATVTTDSIGSPLVLHFGAAMNRFSEDEFFEFCQRNRDLRIERTRSGDLIIMPPSGGETGRTNSGLNYQLVAWNEHAHQGEVFDSSTGFRLPGGPVRSPDAAWVARDRWRALTRDQRKKFPPLAPDFVVEIRSDTDKLKPLRAKMHEYIELGVRLGWLIDPMARRVEIYRPGKKPQTLKAPRTVSGGSVLPGFALELERIWSD
ncbi:MAG TPA: Uma2 family endonuclease [Pirellulales bacterium]|nr:Uma2 family endonuclease [Pirellulales bacterium]